MDAAMLVGNAVPRHNAVTVHYINIIEALHKY